jgi:hypothetical protein
MKKAIGTFGKWCSELDINSSRLMVLSCRPPMGNMLRTCACFSSTRIFSKTVCAAAWVRVKRPVRFCSTFGFGPRSSSFVRYLNVSRMTGG